MIRELKGDAAEPGSQDALRTSPLLFGYPRRDGRLGAGDLLRGNRFRLSSLRSAELVTAFLEPLSPSEAPEGVTSEEIQEARRLGLLVSEEEYRRLGHWERNGWSRAAYLLLGQMDIPGLEEPNTIEDAAVVRGRRRAAVEEYAGEDPYPQPAPLADGPRLSLPPPAPVEHSLSALTGRRSVRAFSPKVPSAQELAGVLYEATSSLRVLAEDRRDGDPFRLLNSFGSWAHLMIVVQDVEAIDPGVYEYSVEAHSLIWAAAAPEDGDLAACVQGQRWAAGPGFVVFVVADMRGYAWLYRHSRAYIHLLMQVGELGQEILMAATALGLGGWTTPAVHESRAAALLGLPDDDALDTLSLVKVGRPLPGRR